MEASILVQLLEDQLDPKYYILSELEVVWLDEEGQPSDTSFYKTPENEAIVADVIANYDALASAYLINLKNEERSNDNYKAIIRRRAKKLEEDGKVIKALLTLKTIGE